MNESHPPAFVSLPDGRVLAGPATTTPDMLTVGAWIDVAGRPAQIRDLRLRAGGGRIAHLARGRPVSFGQHDPVTVYTLVQPSTRRGLA